MGLEKNVIYIRPVALEQVLLHKIHSQHSEKKERIIEGQEGWSYRIHLNIGVFSAAFKIIYFPQKSTLNFVLCDMFQISVVKI